MAVSIFMSIFGERNWAFQRVQSPEVAKGPMGLRGPLARSIVSTGVAQKFVTMFWMFMFISMSGHSPHTDIYIYIYMNYI